ncbi:MAG: hypothetical protein HFG33_01940 [Bacilli bacterium]|nr:hypothetical protein [Bacilli bacterium]
MSYAIFRCDGVKSLSDLINRGKHNKREKESYKTNPDIRIEDSHKNIELIKCDKKYIEKFYDITKNYRLEFNERMKNERSDRKKSFYQMVNNSKSVVADEILFTSDKIFFNSLSEEELMRWADTVLDFVYEDMGYKKEQIIHATLHMDEKTPHIHLVVVPLVKKFDKRVNKERYSISKKAYIKNSIHLSELQDKYWNRLNKNGFKLERGQKNTGVKNLTPKQLKQVTRIFNKDLDNAKWELNRKYRTLINKMESKTKGILNKKIVFDYDTYLELMTYLKQANEAVNKVAKSEGLYKELEKEIKYYKAFLAVNDEKDNQINYLNNKIKKLEHDNNSFKNFIVQLLQALKEVFRNILLFGKDKEKDLVSEQLKECYDNHLYSDNDISDIVKDTSKEIELTNYTEEKDYDYF